MLALKRFDDPKLDESTMRTRLCYALTVAVLTTNAEASTCIWTGVSGSLWSTPANWINCAGGAPVNGDALIFPEAAASKDTTHDQAAFTSAAAISFTGTTSGYALSGAALSIGAGGISNSNTSGSNQIGLNLSLSAAQSFSGSSAAMLLNGPLNLAGQTLKITWPAAGMVTSWSMAGVISGAGTIEVTGATGTFGLELLGNNNFSGTVTLKAGATLLGHNNALGVADGSQANGTFVIAPAALRLANNLSVSNELLSTSGNGVALSFTGQCAWDGPMLLSGPSRTSMQPATAVANSTLTINGLVSGLGGINLGLDPTYAVKLSNSGNTFSGGVATQAFFPAQGGILRLGGDNAIPSASSVLLNGKATLDLNNFDDEIKSLSCTSSDKVIFGFGSTLKIGSSNASTTCAGVLSASGSGGVLAKVGSGVLTLSGANTFDGETDVFGGGLEVSGSLPESAQSVIFVSGGNQNATLFGTGAVGAVVNAGNIHGGSLSTPGTLTTGLLSFNGKGTMSAMLASAASFDQLDASNVNMAANPQLNLAVVPGFIPLPGSIFKLINNRGGAGVGGTFKNLAEGATLTSNGALFVVSYVGGTGNDVILTTINDAFLANGFE